MLSPVSFSQRGQFNFPPSGLLQAGAKLTCEVQTSPEVPGQTNENGREWRTRTAPWLSSSADPGIATFQYNSSVKRTVRSGSAGLVRRFAIAPVQSAPGFQR